MLNYLKFLKNFIYLLPKAEGSSLLWNFPSTLAGISFGSHLAPAGHIGTQKTSSRRVDYILEDTFGKGCGGYRVAKMYLSYHHPGQWRHLEIDFSSQIRLHWKILLDAQSWHRSIYHCTE